MTADRLRGEAFETFETLSNAQNPLDQSKEFGSRKAIEFPCTPAKLGPKHSPKRSSALSCRKLVSRPILDIGSYR